MTGVFVDLTSPQAPRGTRPIGYVICETGCWEWVGALDLHGYGLLHRENHTSRAHRWVYEHEGRVIPGGFDLHHRCENRRCVNPAHLEPVSRRTHLVDRHPLTTVVGQHAQRTHCPHGHPYGEEAQAGRVRRCTVCTTARERERVRDPVARRAYNQAYWKRNRERLSKAHRAWVAAHRDEVREYHRQWKAQRRARRAKS